ncbi:hypothetical protein JTE90_009791 [Oedothorax gibbosus]|uniref:C2H2-type domain-containing protein n=1 Tax=Oedothorax gibbosus TaxID=931172 RepID=A0AAV6TRM9_9ARAC|nr:hypothetical protein JTE90_009791 [Oedothorax gibbosus]
MSLSFLVIMNPGVPVIVDTSVPLITNPDVPVIMNLNVPVIKDPENPYTCKDCNTAFSQASDFQQHLSTHAVESNKNSGETKPLPSTSSPKTSDIPSQLQELSHKEAELHSCEVCGRQFDKKLSLIMHLSTHSSGDKPFPCNTCERLFPLPITFS